MIKVKCSLLLLLLVTPPLFAQEETATEVVTTVTEPVLDLGEEVLDTVDEVPDTAGGAIGDVTDASGLAGIVGQDLADDIGGVVDGVLDIVDNIVETVTDVLRDLTGLLSTDNTESGTGTMEISCDAIREAAVLEPQSAADGNPLLPAPGELGAADPGKCES